MQFYGNLWWNALILSKIHLILCILGLFLAKIARFGAFLEIFGCFFLTSYHIFLSKMSCFCHILAHFGLKWPYFGEKYLISRYFLWCSARNFCRKWAVFAQFVAFLWHFEQYLALFCPKSGILGWFLTKICDAVPWIFLHFQRKRGVFDDILGISAQNMSKNDYFLAIWGVFCRYHITILWCVIRNNSQK